MISHLVETRLFRGTAILLAGVMAYSPSALGSLPPFVWWYPLGVGGIVAANDTTNGQIDHSTGTTSNGTGDPFSILLRLFLLGI